MFDRVERGRFLVDPTRENPLPLFAGLEHVDLDKGAGEFFVFPRRRGFAGTQAHQHILPPRGLTRPKRDVLNDAVALVEDGKHGNALRHGRYASRVGRGRRGPVVLRLRTRLRLAGTIARGQGQCEQERNGGLLHAYSGIHGS